MYVPYISLICLTGEKGAYILAYESLSCMCERMSVVKSAQRALTVLEAVARADGGLTHSEISHALDIPSGSLTPLLSTLCNLGYLSLDSGKKKYVLGSSVLFLAWRYQESLDIVHIGEPFLSELVYLTGESAAIVIESGDQVTVVAKQNSPRPLRPSLELGGRAPLYAGASGKVFLADRSDQEIDRYLSTVELKSFTPHTTKDPHLIWKQLRAIRKGALAYSRESLFEGVTAVAAPVRNMSGKLVATMIVTAPTVRFGPERAAFIEKALRKTSAAFSRKLGYREGEGAGSFLSGRIKDRERLGEDLPPL